MGHTEFGSEWVDTISACTDDQNASAVLRCIQKDDSNGERHCWSFSNWRHTDNGFLSDGVIVNKETNKRREIKLRLGAQEGLILKDDPLLKKQFSLKAQELPGGKWMIPLGPTLSTNDRVENAARNIIAMVGRGRDWHDRNGEIVRSPWGDVSVGRNGFESMPPPTYFGSWTIRIGEDRDVVSKHQARCIESFLNNHYVPGVRRLYGELYRNRENLALQRWGIPAFVVRCDMAPMQDDFKGVHEVEANIAGLGMCECKLGVPVADKIAHCLKEADIHRMRYGVMESRKDQLKDLEEFMTPLRSAGIDAICGSFDSDDLPLWLRAGEEDSKDLTSLMSRCLLLHHHGGGDKSYLCHIDKAQRLSEFDDIKSLELAFPNGFVVKPTKGWGTRSVYPWAPTPHSRYNASRRQLSDLLSSEAKNGFIVQPFRKPGAGRYGERIWRVFAVWNPNNRAYRLLGGIAMDRRSLLIHGASDAVSNPLFVEK